MTRSAVAMFAFNRPEKTARVFAAVRAARPPRLFLVCDGPRADRDGEAAQCEAVRKVLSAVDWPCEVERHFADVNLGCRQRISSGIAWVFSRVDEAVFLEDDTLPEASFFDYCDALLERYRDDNRVLMVSGYSRLGYGGRDHASYWFSAYPRIWGWASWRRAWHAYDVSMSDWPAAKTTPAWTSRNENEREAWGGFFDAVKAGNVDTWDAQVTLMAWRTGGLTAIPAVNLVANIGFGEGGTNTGASVYAGPPVRSMPTAMVHPALVRRNEELDAAWLEVERPVSSMRLRRMLKRSMHWLRGR